MGLLRRMFGKAITAPVGVDPRGWSMLSGSWPSRWSKAEEIFSPSSISDMEKSYVHPIIRACVDEISTSLSEPRLEVGVYTGKEWKPLEGHPSLDLLNNPNESWDYATLLQFWSMRTELTGSGYIWKLRGLTGKLTTELWSIPTSWVESIPGKGTQLSGGYKIRGQKRIIDPKDMIVMRCPTPWDQVSGCGPYESAQHDHALDVEGERFLAETLLNQKVPGLIVNVKSELTEKQREVAKKEIRDAVGYGNRGDTLLLEGEAEAKILSPLADLDWPGFFGTRETRICMAFGVPPIIIGSKFGLTRSTYANYESARRSLYMETLSPKWNRIASVLTLNLLRAEGESRLVYRFRTDELPEFQEDATAKSTRIISQFTSSVISRREARSQLGYDPDYPVEDDLQEEEQLGLQNQDEETDSEEEPKDSEEEKDSNFPPDEENKE